jgi:signal peptidase
VSLTVHKARYVRSETAGPAPIAPIDDSTAPVVRRRGVAREVLFAVAGVAGLISVLWLVASLVFGYSIIIFQTGSMSPSMPTGALAIEHAIAAPDIRVGDVVTVADPGHALPVTHRVVSIAADPQRADGRLLTLKGDDNLSPDQFAYPVTTAKRVLLSAPVLGTVLIALHQPIFVGLATLLVAFLILAAFWPARTSRHRRAQ